MNPLREILAFFSVDTSGVKKGIKESDGLIGGLKRELAKLGGAVAGAFAVGHLVSFGAELMREAEATAALAGTLGLATAELQGWQWAAESSGVAAEKLTGAVRKLQQAAADPVKAGAFKRYDIELKEADGTIRDTNDLLSDTAAALVAIEDPQKRAAAAMDLFGGAGADLLPLLAKGEDGIADLRGEVEKLGFAFSDDFVKKSSEVNANVDRLKASFKGLVIQGLGLLLPSLIELTELALGAAKWIAEITKEFSDWTKETKLAESAMAMLSIKGIMMLVGGLGKAIAGMGGLRMAFMRLLPLLWKVLLPMLAIEDFLVFLAGGKSVLGKVLDGLFGDGSAESFRDTLKEIIKDLKDGNIGEALRKSFDGVATMFAAIGEAITKGLIKLWNMFVEKSGSLATLLGLEKIDENAIEPARSSYEREKEKTDQLRSGTETEGQRQAREAFVPGASEVTAALRAHGIGANQALGDFPALTGQQDKDGTIKLLGEAAKTLEAATNWVEDYGKPSEFAMPGQIPAQNVENHVSIENRITVQVPPGEADLGSRVGQAAKGGAAQVFDARAIQAALVPQPVR